MSIELNLDETGEQIVYYIRVVKQNRGAQNKELFSFLGVAPHTLSTHLDALMENDIVERVQKEKNSKVLVFIMSRLGLQLFDYKYPQGSAALSRIAREKVQAPTREMFTASP